MNEPIIVCENLVKIYKLLDDVEVQALQGLELTIATGEMVGVVGASGSGKSTLLNILGGLVTPSAGRAFVNGKNLAKLSSRELDRYRRESVGFVWQQGARNLIHYLNAVENVEYPMQLTGRGGRANRQRAEMLLELVGLKDRRYHHLGSMSGGEQQRVAIAIALANEPTLLLADEPTGELDTATSLQIYAMFKQFNRELGLTTLIVSHDPGIARHVDRVIGIRDGKLASETVRKVQRASHEKVVDREGEISAENTPSETFEELTVLDSAGRLQIPKAIRQQHGIDSRVTLEVTDDGVIIKPIKQ
ncbi:MAG: ATP-binding cassette domain-containing protein [Candidatus Promineifilaceae bacterium]